MGRQGRTRAVTVFPAPGTAVVPAAARTAVAAALAPVVGHGERVVLAVSGGPDSVALAVLVRAARPDLRAVVVHVRHGLRDDAADAAAATAHARPLGLAARVVSVTVRPAGAGVEAAARDARYAALAAAARAEGAGHVLVGHSADDAAETVLLNVARGTGLRGLAGMPPVRPLADGVTLVRPLLTLRRALLGEIAASTGLPVAADPTNHDAEQRRARARHDLLPALAELTGASSDPVVALARLAEHARRDADALDAIAARHARRLLRRWGPVRSIDRGALERLPAAVATRVVRLLLHAATGPAGTGAHPLSAATVAAVLDLRPGGAVSLPGGLLATVGGGVLAVAPAAPATLAERPVDGAVDLPEIGVRLRCDDGQQGRLGALPPWAPPRAAAMVAVPLDGALHVRARRPGDRIRTAAGTRTVAAAMADAGVPRPARGLVPVVADARGPVWIPGVAVRADSTGPLRLRLEPLAADRAGAGPATS